MTLRRVGFFRELRHGEPDGPSLKVELGQLRADPERLAVYLETASVLAANGPFDDVLSGREWVGELDIQTDGDYEWPSDLAYYVREYRVGVGEDFVAHCERHGWSPRILAEDELIALSNAQLAEEEEGFA